MTSLYPLTFTPVLKHYLWGGRNLEQIGRQLPLTGSVAESWEIAGHADGTTVVDNGPFTGQPLTAVQDVLGLDLIGRRNAWAHARGKFPLLVKLLDAHAPLSVQVHPDDHYALAHEDNELGKTEMWVVLRAEPDAHIILGVKAGANATNFREAVALGRLEPFLHVLPVKAGDHICVPAGTLHAIMGGLLMVEIQQNSNATYRVYDWGRVSANGQPRPLHVDKALAVIDFEKVEPTVEQATFVAAADGVQRWDLCRNRYFVTERLVMAPGAVFHGACLGDTLEIWGTLTGEVDINDVRLPAVRFSLLPAALGPFSVRAEAPSTLLRTYVA
jgi:mannose-6-phosphate isomerase